MAPALSNPGPGPDRTDQPLPPGFGDALRLARQQSGLTKKALAERLGDAGASISPRTITAWEQTAQEPASGWPVGMLERVVGVPEYTLLIRLTGHIRDQDALDRRRTAPPGWLDTVTTSVSQRIHVGPDGRVAFIETTQRVRAMVPDATTYFFRYAQDDAERVRVTTLSGCEVGNWRHVSKHLADVPITLEGSPMAVGEERTFRYRVGHTHVIRPVGPATAEELRHRGNGTPTLQRLEMEVIFAAPRWHVRQCYWPNRYAEPVPMRRWERVAGQRAQRMEWPNPREHAYGVVWCPPV